MNIFTPAQLNRIVVRGSGVIKTVEYRKIACAVAILTIAAVGCGKSDRVELTESISVAPRQPMTGMAKSGGSPVSAASIARAMTSQPKMTWTKPEGWKRLPATQFRDPNFASGAVECYVSVMPKSGGGVLENANRWRKQMGLPPVSQPELDAFSKVTVLRKQAVRVEFDGDFQGMGQGPSKPNYALIGVLLELDTTSVFVKMVGPREEVATETVHFDEFVRSLQASSAPATNAAAQPPTTQLASATLPAGHPPLAASDMPAAMPAESGVLPAGHPPIATDPQGETPSPPAGGLKTRGQGLVWSVPNGWNQAPDRAMRLVSYTMENSDSAECYVTLLNDSAGGIEKTVNHWLSQVGQPAKTAEEIAALPTIDVFGRPTPLIEGTSAETDGSARAFAGIAWISPTGSFFAKLTGSASDVAANKAAFTEFCTSFARE